MRLTKEYADLVDKECERWESKGEVTFMSGLPASRVLDLKEENLALRRMLAMLYCGPLLYTDDGELCDGRECPTIDFLRYDPGTIAQLMRQRAQKAAGIPDIEENQ